MAQTALSESLRAAEMEIAAGRAERALELSQQLQSRYPRALHVQRVLGEAFLALRKTREALGALDRVLVGNPEDARTYCARAIVQQMHGDSHAALNWYRRACDITPDDAVLRAAYNELATSLGQPPYTPTRVGLARLYLRGDLFDHAIREWEDILAEQPDHLEAQVGLAESLWRAGYIAPAVDRCQRTLANAPSCVKPMLILAVIEHDAGRDDEAQRMLRSATELDPEARIGQALFADRLIAGDTGLRLLLFGEPHAVRPTGAPAGVRSQPVSSRPVAAPQAALSATPPGSSAGVSTMPAPAAPARSGMIPPDFHTIFAETKYMLWGSEDDEELAHQATMPQPAADRLPAGPPLPQSAAGPAAPGVNGETAGRMAAAVPPAMRQAGMTMEDTEARAAINWLSWLRAQGARAPEATGDVSGAPPVSPPAPPRGPRLTQPVAPVDAGAAPTGPLPPPSPEALRKMFAELGGDTASQRFVEGQVVRSSPAPPATSVPYATPALGSPIVGDGAARGSAGDAEESVAQASQESALEADGAARQPITLEELEGAYSSSGFRAMELHPGDLALLASQSGGETAAAGGDGEPRLPLEEHDETLAAVAADVAAAEEPASTTNEPEPAAPAEVLPVEHEPQDYGERLERARSRRADGALPDALSDYRLILKNAPDLLPEVLSDLDELLAAHADQPEVHRLVGDARIRQGDYLSAIESYNHAVALSQERNG
jgi:tetratricopeptide (TPR) repeat protein